MIKHIELIWVLVLGLPISLPNRILSLKWHPYLLIALFLFVAIRYWHLVSLRFCGSQLHHRLYSLHPLTLSCFLLLLCFPVSLWASADKAMSMSTAGYILWGIVLFDTLTQYPMATVRPQILVWFFVGGGTLFSIIALPIVAWKPQFLLFHLPIYEQLQTLNVNIGETIHANVLASVIAILLPILFAIVIRHDVNLSSRIALSITSLLLMGILVLTQSRGAYVAMLIVLPSVALLRWHKVPFISWVLTLIAICLVLYFRLAETSDFLRDYGSLGGWTGRVDIWMQSVNAIYDFSFTGIGFGTFSLVMPLLYPLKVSVTDYPHAHNLFLQIALDLGIPGFIAYLSLMINLFTMLTVTLRSSYTETFDRTLTIGATGSLIAMLVHGLLDIANWGTKLAFMPWLLFALITVLFQHSQQSRYDNSHISN